MPRCHVDIIRKRAEHFWHSMRAEYRTSWPPSRWLPSHWQLRPNRLVASFIVAGVILWGAGVIALVFYVRAETSRSNARKELVDKCLGSGGHLVYDPIQKIACSFKVPTYTLDDTDNR